MRLVEGDEALGRALHRVQEYRRVVGEVHVREGAEVPANLVQRSGEVRGRSILRRSQALLHYADFVVDVRDEPKRPQVNLLDAVVGLLGCKTLHIQPGPERSSRNRQHCHEAEGIAQQAPVMCRRCVQVPGSSCCGASNFAADRTSSKSESLAGR